MRAWALTQRIKKKYGKYSLGMKQRLAVAQAVMERPRLLLLDEPTNALDAKGVELVRNIILEERQRGATVLIASHNREDLCVLCDRFLKWTPAGWRRTRSSKKAWGNGMRARAYLIPAALVLAGVVIALCTRFSYRDIGTEYLDFNYAGNIDANFLNDENNKTQGIHSADDLLARCDAAVLCTFTGKRQMTDEAMYQDMKVLEVLKV